MRVRERERAREHGRLTMKVATHSAITAWRKDTELSSVEKVSGILETAPSP